MKEIQLNIDKEGYTSDKKNISQIPKIQHMPNTTNMRNTT